VLEVINNYGYIKVEMKQMSSEASQDRALREAAAAPDAVLIVPPFFPVDYPALGVHMLQACAREAGLDVRVVYANLLLAARIGEEAYSTLMYSPTRTLLGERFFARCAYGLPALGRRPERALAGWCAPQDREIQMRRLLELERLAQPFAEEVAEAVAALGARVVGSSSSFAQTAASIALLKAVKARRPEVVTLLGGANCEGEMAAGIASLGAVDHVFSGESERAFPDFLLGLRRGIRPPDPVVQGEPCEDLESLPGPRFDEFFAQREQHLTTGFLPADQAALSYETSRGCWWGQKRHCTFCGLNGEGMGFREKSPDKVLRELRALLAASPTRRVLMTDNIMPHRFFATLVPRLAEELPDLRIFYEQKANLTLQHVLSLKRAGINTIQPGIEALSTRLLGLMRKGVLARQNLMLLRYARAAALNLRWNLIWGFPGDEIAAYRETLELLPLLHHLPPPSGAGRLRIDRFSPYHTSPEEYGIREIQPWTGYFDVLPDGAEIGRIAYHFSGAYRSEALEHRAVIEELIREASCWHGRWKQGAGEAPVLEVRRSGEDLLLADSRDLPDTDAELVLSRDQAMAVLAAGPATGSPVESWAVERRLAVLVDGWKIPLATADPALLREFESAGPAGS
jgi:ribosomal peptide maturation radical SAM protein 1